MSKGGYRFYNIDENERIIKNKIDYEFIPKTEQEKDILKWIEIIKSRIINKNIYFPIKYSDLTNDFEYGELKNDEYKIYNTNCHVGQRKLLLNEIQYYNKHVPKDKEVIVMYVGSASGHHTPVILDMFPNIKLLLVDPGYHDINRSYSYIYQNYNIINETTFEPNKNTKDNISNYIIKNNELIKKRKKDIEFTDYTKINFLQDNIKRDILNPDKKEMDKIMNDFKNKDYIDLIKKIKESNDRVFIIQDYCDGDMCKLIKKSLDKYNEKIYFLSDIRTVLIDDAPSDLDILLNNILQVDFLKILKPESSMLKFRPYYLTSINKEYMKNLKEGKNLTPILESMKNNLDNAKKNYNIDFLKEYFNKKCYYFQGDIYLQPWGPKGSTETRLIVLKNDIDKKFINYDIKEWEDKHYTFNRWKQFKWINPFYEKIKDYKKIKYDYCIDCGIEIAILMSYITGIDESNTEKIKNNMTKKNIDLLIELYNKINYISNTNFTDSNMCLLPHSTIYDKYVNMYFIKNNDYYGNKILKFNYNTEEDKVVFKGFVKRFKKKLNLKNK